MSGGGIWVSSGTAMASRVQLTASLVVDRGEGRWTAVA